MSLSYFGDKALVPGEADLAAVLGPGLADWEEIKARVYSGQNPGDGWKYYGKSAGWTYKLFSGKRNLLFLVPQEGFFKVNFVFGEAAARKVLAADIPAGIKEALESAKVYAEGRSVMFDVKTRADLDVALRLLEIKKEN